MKKIFTLFALVLIVAASQSMTAAAQGTIKPFVSPNPAHDFIKVNWQQSQCYNVTMALYNTSGILAKTLVNHQYCDGIYSETFKVTGLNRGTYMMRITIGTQTWWYKQMIQ